jgi:hypothetical protein
MLLRPGEAGRSLQIELSPPDFARDQLVVSFSVQGEGSTPQCPTSVGLDAIVEIETTSAIYLTLDRPLESPRDRVRAWGGQALIAWPNSLPTDARLERFTQAVDLERNGINSLFRAAPQPEAFAGADLRSFHMQITQRDIPTQTATWPPSIAHKGANAGLRRFHRSTQWRTRYDLQSTAELRLPTQLELQFVLGRKIDGEHWSLIVSLNNRLIHQSLIEATQTHVEIVAALPLEMHTAMNVLDITLSSTRAHTGNCDLGPELVAELLPSSRLVTGEDVYSDALIELRHTLSALGDLHIWTTPQMTAADAQVASRMIAQILPQATQIKPASGAAHIFVVSSQGADQYFARTDDVWIIGLDAETRMISVRRLKHKSQIQDTSLALVVSATPLPIAQVKL